MHKLWSFYCSKHNVLSRPPTIHACTKKKATECINNEAVTSPPKGADIAREAFDIEIELQFQPMLSQGKDPEDKYLGHTCTPGIHKRRDLKWPHFLFKPAIWHTRKSHSTSLTTTEPKARNR